MFTDADDDRALGALAKDLNVQLAENIISLTIDGINGDKIVHLDYNDWRRMSGNQRADAIHALAHDATAGLPFTITTYTVR